MPITSSKSAPASSTANSTTTSTDGTNNPQQPDLPRFVTVSEALRCQRLTLELQCAGLEAMARHAVEEYARPMGHVDLLRERIDGRLGQ